MHDSLDRGVAPVVSTTRVLAALASITIASQFFRASISALGPELIRDLELSPGALGLGNAAFFVALLVAQIPIGMLFDRLGTRRVVTVLMAFTVLGALLQAGARSEAGFVLARFLVGLGCAGSFMAAVVECSLSFGGRGFSTMLSRVYALSGIGYLLAGSPWTVFAAWLGWRAAFAASAALAAGIAYGFFLLIRDRPREATTAHRQNLAEILAGFRPVWKTVGLLPIGAMHFVAYAAFLTVFGIWAGLYLNDVYGLDSIARGNVLLGMGATQILSTIVYGPLDRWLSRRTIVTVAAASSIALLAVLIIVPHPPLTIITSVLLIFSGVSAFSVINVADVNSRFPPNLAGRGATTVNLFQVVGTSVLPILGGTIIGLYPENHGVRPEDAYRTALAVIALCLAAGLAIYGLLYAAPAGGPARIMAPTPPAPPAGAPGETSVTAARHRGS